VIPKYRAWDTVQNQMFNTGFHISPHNGVALSLKYIGKDSEGWYRNDDLILMQSTGLHDKNGVEIFEGDIVYFDKVNWKVIWMDYQWFYLSPKDQREEFPGFSHVKVIGNIHENPELMEAAQV